MKVDNASISFRHQRFSFDDELTSHPAMCYLAHKKEWKIMNPRSSMNKNEASVSLVDLKQPRTWYFFVIMFVWPWSLILKQRSDTVWIKWRQCLLDMSSNSNHVVKNTEVWCYNVERWLQLKQRFLKSVTIVCIIYWLVYSLCKHPCTRSDSLFLFDNFFDFLLVVHINTYYLSIEARPYGFWKHICQYTKCTWLTLQSMILYLLISLTQIYFLKYFCFTNL